MLRAVQLAAVAAVETSPAHCPHRVPMLAATRRSIGNVLQVISLVPRYLITLLASASIENLDILLPPALGTLFRNLAPPGVAFRLFPRPERPFRHLAR